MQRPTTKQAQHVTARDSRCFQTHPLPAQPPLGRPQAAAPCTCWPGTAVSPRTSAGRPGSSGRRWGWGCPAGPACPAAGRQHTAGFRDLNLDWLHNNKEQSLGAGNGSTTVSAGVAEAVPAADKSTAFLRSLTHQPHLLPVTPLLLTLTMGPAAAGAILKLNSIRYLQQQQQFEYTISSTAL